MTAPAIGSPAPEFSIPSTGGTASLGAHRGQKHVLIAFYPLAFTSTCTAELCAFTDDFDQFASRDVAVVPISVDAVPSLKEFKAKYKMGVELASDFKRDVSRAYGVLNPEKFYSNRAYFLVDKGGVLRWSHVEGNNSERRENADILAAIARLA